MIGFCGDNCGACPRYLATKSGSKSELEKVAAMWMRCGLRGTVVSPEAISCPGCPAGNPCPDGINACASERKAVNCGRCAEYPCVKINNTLQRTLELDKKLKELCSKKDYGILKKAFLLKRSNLEKGRNK